MPINSLAFQSACGMATRAISYPVLDLLEGVLQKAQQQSCVHQFKLVHHVQPLPTGTQEEGRGLGLEMACANTSVTPHIRPLLVPSMAYRL